ncbi:MAG: LysO family transporter [Paludibacter sp.]|nr:LysO family transporter [Paludibacter sp.]
MYTVLLFIVGGIATGFLFRKKKIGFINHVITALIWLLLFVLGIEVGLNDHVVKQFHLLGLEAFLIALFATAGSVIGAWLLWRKQA